MIGVGIIGYGRIGAEHSGWIRRAAGMYPAAVADATPARRAAAIAHGLKAHDSIAAMLADPGVSAVLVSTPTAMHFEHASAAIAAGKHVMIEKPMAIDLAQSRQLVELGRRHDRVISVFHNRRWDLDYLTVKSAVDAGKFGRLINVETRLGQWSSCVGPATPEYRPNWRNEAAFGGGGLFDWGSHFLDQLWLLLAPAKPVRVFAQLRGNVWSNDCDDFARVLIDFDTGAVAVAEVNTTTTLPLPRWHIDGTSASASAPFSREFDVKKWAELDFRPAKSAQFAQLENLPGVAGPPPVERLPLAAPGLDERSIWEHFAAAVRGDGTPAVSAQSALATMALLDAARESSRTGRAIQLDPDLQSLFQV